MPYARRMVTPATAQHPPSHPESQPPLQVALRRGAARVGWVLLFGVGVVLLWWFITNPEPLATRTEPISTTAAAGSSVYVGVYTPPAGDARTLHVAGVKVHTTADVEVTVTPLLCRGGTIGVTTTPEPFCTELVDPEDEQLGAGSGIVLRIDTDAAGTAEIDRIRIAYRDGLQWATQEAGAPISVEILAR